jgi:cellobiose phosphorylase
MFGNALYKQGFAKEGYKAIHTLYKQSCDFEISRIYPGIPEYFSDRGRGMYNYLTGAASWLMMTVITQVFGVRGDMGDLLFDPKLLKEQFDENGEASLNLQFAGKDFIVQYHNPDKLDYDAYTIGKIVVNGAELSPGADRVSLTDIQKMDNGKQNVEITLIAK